MRIIMLSGCGSSRSYKYKCSDKLGRLFEVGFAARFIVCLIGKPVLRNQLSRGEATPLKVFRTFKTL